VSAAYGPFGIPHATREHARMVAPWKPAMDPAKDLGRTVAPSGVSVLV
jgi:hypothetical protein